MTPRLSVCQLTLPDTTFEEDLQLIAAAGASGVGVTESKLRAGADAQHVAAVRASGLAAAGCIPANISPLPLRHGAELDDASMAFPGPTDVDERVALMCRSVERLAPFGPDSIAAITGSPQGYSSKDARRIAVDALQEVGKVAAAHGTRIAVEATRTDLGVDLSFLNTIPDTIDFLDEVGSDAVGLCFDFYHLWDTDNVLEHTERHADRVFSVQYNDYRQRQATLDRVLPGDGLMDIPGMLGALERGGFSGWYEFELFSDDGRFGTELADSLWKLPPAVLLERAQAKFLAAWEARTAP